MKKIVLIALAGILALGSYAEEKIPAKKTDRVVNKKVYMDAEMPSKPATIVSTNHEFKGTQAVDRKYIGKSANIYSILLSEQRALDYNEAVGMASFTFRADPATYEGAMGNSGSILTATSSDNENWSELWSLASSDIYARYPSGVIYNPEGNTDPEQALVVSAGPVSDGSGWVSTFFASNTIDGNNGVYVMEDVDGSYSGSQLIRNGLQATEDGMAHIMGSKYQDNGSGLSTEMNLNVWNGEYTDDEFEWDYVDVEVDLAFRSDGTTKNFWTFGNAWANDGSVGYMWLIGQTSDLEENGGYQPIVFKSEDAGESWDEVEILLEDNEVISEYLMATEQGEGPVWPMCTEATGVVDMNGDLQMFIKATGTYSTHPDSIGYTYTGALDYIFNLEVTEDGVQNVMFVDSVLAADVADDSEAAFGTVGWDARLQASKSPAGDAIFVVWNDTETPDLYDGENGAPNIKAAGKLLGGTFADFPVTNFTSDDLYAGFYFFIYVAQQSYIANEDGASYLHIPVTTSISPNEYSGDDDLAPVTHSYVDGIKFLWTTGQNEIAAATKNIEVSQNQPNPFSGSTAIEISSNTTAPAVIEISNIMGQTVKTIHAGTIVGSQRVNIDASNWESGVYFYTVTVGNESLSKKMIVE